MKTGFHTPPICKESDIFLRVVGFAFAAFFLLLGCDESPGPHPAIEQIQPERGVPGQTIHIQGRNFGSSVGDSTVSFTRHSSGVLAEVVDWVDDAIRVTIPPDAASGFTYVRVVVDGRSSNLFPYHILGDSPPDDVQDDAADTEVPETTPDDPTAEPNGGYQVDIELDAEPNGAVIWPEVGEVYHDTFELLIMGQDLPALAGVAFVLEVGDEISLVRVGNQNGLAPAGVRTKLLAEQRGGVVVVGYTQLERRRQGVDIGEPMVLLGLLFRIESTGSFDLDFVQPRTHLRNGHRQYIEGRTIDARVTIR